MRLSAGAITNLHLSNKMLSFASETYPRDLIFNLLNSFKNLFKILLLKFQMFINMYSK